MAISESTVALPSPSLQSTLHGHLDDKTGVVSFRGIPYATLTKRWTHSTLKSTLDEPDFDSTRFGHRCPQQDGVVLVSGGNNDPTPGDDEFKCLNLNIAVHREHLRAGSKLPVMVWIHGGAFVFGANSVARYRPERFLNQACAFGTPVVLVQINYRLGVFGFSAPEDLREEASEAGNYGLTDQQRAFEWVRDHIEDFGGDPGNVTAFGVSAGSASVHYHVLTGKALFDRGILMSGAAGTLGPLPRAVYQAMWDDMVNKCQLTSETSASRLEKLRAIDAKNLAGIHSTRASGPIGGSSGDLTLPLSWDAGAITPQSRCKALIVGDTRVEGVILLGLIKALPYQRFRQLASVHFGDGLEAFLVAFGFTSDEPSAEQYRDAMFHMFSVMLFQHAGTFAAQSFAEHGKSYVYHFEEPSPFAGPTFGMPYHGQCALYLHLNESEAVPDSGNATSKEMVRLWTKFAYGDEPWEGVPAVEQELSFMRFGPEGRGEMHTYTTDKLRNYDFVEYLASHLDQTKTFVQSLLHPPQ